MPPVERPVLEHAWGGCCGQWSMIPDEENPAAPRPVIVCYECGASMTPDQKHLDQALMENWHGYLLGVLTNEGVWIKLFGSAP